MEEKQELEDILISEEDSKKGGQKKILLFSAAAILLFLIAIFVVFSGEEEADKAQNSEGMITSQLEENTPEGTDAASPEAKEPESSKQDGKFEQMPIESKEESVDDKFEQIVQKIKKDQEQRAKEKKEVPKPEPKATASQQAQEPKQSAETTAAKEQPKAEASKQKTAAETEKQKSADISQDFATTVPKGYYVQVGSFSRYSPNDKFITAIKEKGYSYQLLKVGSGDTQSTKVLIGPYSSKGDVQEVIGTIKKDIAEGAFIKRVQ